ncbi:uncharacterized protein K452DRAFT_89873 [Aplosporella prunicola CBS 121167]|uniref:Uncharacterized protein n=1 Tax=Aplosporella prunicola CBS 121167 TaxID=1176127 RepID=A0A6A6B5E0_9PEZI|nr:uncharacterized protein K452DRAFT_89873 [Aplosporella prunicola CBS 121167]KAF2138197.1 hypothetical protein K452DRAFT_89873 [Aplosporella prunicola CBS 121167]
MSAECWRWRLARCARVFVGKRHSGGHSHRAEPRATAVTGRGFGCGALAADAGWMDGWMDGWIGGGVELAEALALGCIDRCLREPSRSARRGRNSCKPHLCPRYVNARLTKSTVPRISAVRTNRDRDNAALRPALVGLLPWLAFLSAHFFRSPRADVFVFALRFTTRAECVSCVCSKRKGWPGLGVRVVPRWLEDRGGVYSRL